MMFRQLVTKLQSLMIERRIAPRHRFYVPIEISIPSEKNPGAQLLNRKTFSTRGVTKDLSEAGLAFYVSSIRLNECYLVGEERPLIARLDLPEGEITLKIVGVRYERENANFIELKYLIGARISEMKAADREIYREFLRQNDKLEKVLIQDFSVETPES